MLVLNEHKFPLDNVTHVTIPGAVHQLGTAAIRYKVYSLGSPAEDLSSTHYVDPMTYDFTLTFLMPVIGLLALAPFSASQKERIFQAFEAIDFQALEATDPLAPRLHNFTDMGLTKHGYVSLDGLLRVAEVIATINREIQRSSCDSVPFSP